MPKILTRRKKQVEQTFEKGMFYSQELFSTLLSLERKRCERSGNKFGLALLEICHLADAAPLRDALCSQLRETDIVGWYRASSVIGIIFTSLNGTAVPDLRAKLHAKIDEAMLSVLSQKDMDKVLVTLFIFPEDVDEELYPELEKNAKKTTYRAIKRLIDIGFSLTMLILLSPVFLVIAILVKRSSPGPVFFRQKRLGMMGKRFDFLKFRTMYANNDPAIHQQYVKKLIEGQQDPNKPYKIQNDPRVTPLGRFLRKMSLDELPQFINVLRGDMSLVGPRPPIPYELENYRCWHKRRVLEARPGLTGLWQVQGRSRMTFDEMVRLDIRYITEQCGWLDFKIVLLTPRAILTAAGAY
jgi:lipopolysaccharide/colanic/teichoic acid biosynthesis glycosyltransferase